ncbi:MAG: hypothetical protein K0S25_2195 [Bacillus sp. (in: firmicutes)]|jgi:hypothetical protein|nr:hypothetical protein [Bacillus sp. (in: firmicutes)]
MMGILFSLFPRLIIMWIRVTFLISKIASKLEFFLRMPSLA